MNEEEIKNSIEKLRAHRSSIIELREYKPQARGKKASAEPVRPTEEVFSGLFTEAVEEVPSNGPDQTRPDQGV
jgi:hypothetical protein